MSEIDPTLDQRPHDPAGVAPDPSGVPEPVLQDLDENATLNCIAAVGVGLVVIGGLMLPVTVSPTCGATRSAKIRWETRRQAVEQAIVAQRVASGLPAMENADEHSAKR